MSGFVIMGEDEARELFENREKDFEKNAESFGLDKSKEYDFICLSFEPGQQILPQVHKKLNEWPVGKCRGYINEYDILCINIPMTPGETSSEDEDIFMLLKQSRQEYYDLESSNWDCYRADFPKGIDSIDFLMDKWNNK